MNKFMKKALLEAKVGIELGHGGPFGAIIVKDNKIISKAHNTVLLKKDPTCHGEIEAIRKACKKLKTHDLSDCDIYTTGYPCPMCKRAILWSNIKNVYYGCDANDIDKIGFRDKVFESNLNNFQKEKCFELDRKECLNLYNEYNNIKNKKLY